MKKAIPAAMLLLGFLLGIRDGYVALWTDANPQPQVFPYRAALLPEADQKKLAEGIHIENAEELRRLLEDYLS